MGAFGQNFHIQGPVSAGQNSKQILEIDLPAGTCHTTARFMICAPDGASLILYAPGQVPVYFYYNKQSPVWEYDWFSASTVVTDKRTPLQRFAEDVAVDVEDDVLPVVKASVLLSSQGDADAHIMDFSLLISYPNPE